MSYEQVLSEQAKLVQQDILQRKQELSAQRTKLMQERNSLNHKINLIECDFKDLVDQQRLIRHQQSVLLTNERNSFTNKE